MKSKKQVLIIGGGTAGITVAAQLLRKNSKLDIGLIEPSEKHYYQPAYTLVGAGTYKMEDTIKSEASVMPKGVDWIKDYASEMDPDNNIVKLRGGDEIEYEYLIVAPGIQINLDGVEGLKETMNKNGVCSNYVDAEYTWEVLSNFKGGNAIFTQPATPIKCGGAPQKIMYMAEEYMVKHGLRDKTNIGFLTNGSVVFGVPEFKKTLEEIIDKRDIAVKFFMKLTKIDGPGKKAYYELLPYEAGAQTGLHEDIDLGMKKVGDLYEVPFDMLHLAPPQSAPDFVRKSKVACPEGPDKGWVDVDIHTLQHKRFDNIFSLGDVAALPTAKTGAAVRKQAPVVVENLLRLINGQSIQRDHIYTGYSSCPLVTGYSKMLLAEFGYENKRMSDPMISTFVDTTKEQYSMWLLKKYGLPIMYWKLMLRGLA